LRKRKEKENQLPPGERKGLTTLEKKKPQMVSNLCDRKQKRRGEKKNFLGPRKKSKKELHKKGRGGGRAAISLMRERSSDRKDARGGGGDLSKEGKKNKEIFPARRKEEGVKPSFHLSR